MSRVQDFIAAEPWGITESALQMILEIADDHSRDLEAIERQLGHPLEHTQTVRMQGDIAVIPVSGPLFRYANLFTRISGATSYEVLANEFGAALADPKVRGIILEIDSPGGTVNGNQELAQLIYGARSEKPVGSYISGLGASAAYWIASSASFVWIAETGMAGSIGTVLSTTDTSAQDAKRGVQTIEFVSSQSPKKRLDPFSEDPAKRDVAKSELQKLVDSIAQVFVEKVARNMAVDVQTVLSDFGQGGVLVGQEAVNAGMAHATGTLEQMITHMQGQRRGGGAMLRSGAAGRHSSPSSLSDRESIMAEETNDAGGATQPVIDRAYLEAHHTELIAAFRAEGATAERERIAAIQAINGPEDVIAECVADVSISAGDAALKVLAAQKEREKARAEGHLKQRADTEDDLDAPGPSGDTGAGPQGDYARGKRVAALHNQRKGRSAGAASI